MALTVWVSGLEVARRLREALPGSVLVADEGSVTVPAERIAEAALFLRDDPALDCKYLNALTAVDWVSHFEVVYHLSSLAQNTMLVVKARTGHDSPVVPSVSDVWLGAHLQEREAFDLMGIVFSGHPAMRRIFLWEGFPGHPLRKDFLALPGGFKPGLQRFPFEFPEGQRSYASLQDTASPSAPRVPRLDEPPEAPFPIEQQETAERIAANVQAEAGAPASLAPETQGAGSDVTQAGGTNPDPTQPVVADDEPRRTQALPGEEQPT